MRIFIVSTHESHEAPRIHRVFKTSRLAHDYCQEQNVDPYPRLGYEDEVIYEFVPDHDMVDHDDYEFHYCMELIVTDYEVTE